MLLEIAIGDAYGSGFEYVPEYVTQEYNDLSGYRKHPKHPLEAGQYTDDTQMTLGTAEAMLEIAAGAAPTKELFAKKYVEAFQRDPREGYAQGFYKFLCSVKDADDFLRRILPHSEKSGAAMRAGPIGVLADPYDVREIAEMQAQLTHNTYLGREAAVAAALMVHYFLYEDDDRKGLGKFLNWKVHTEEAWNWNYDWAGKVGAAGWQSVAAAVTGIRKHDNMPDLLKWIVSLRGDVDTAAAIAMAAASCCNEMRTHERGHLPAVLVAGLENGSFGKDYILALDKKLMALLPR